jgi:hypothetical protein
MKPVNIRKIRQHLDTSKLNEEQLTKRLFLHTSITLGLIVISILSLTVFAPAFGSLFKIFAKKGFGNELIIKPNQPVLTQVPNAIKNKNINLSGYAQEGNTVKIFINGPEKGSTVADGEGKFTFDNLELIKGRNTIFLKSIDNTNNESDPSNTYIINFDEDAPKIDIVSPKKDELIKNLDSRVTIKGKLNEKATLTINDQIAIVKSDLTFEHTLGVKEGKTEVKIKAIDEAGNEKEEKIIINYQKKAD